MLKYLIISLSNDSVSFCHYECGTGHELIDLQSLKRALHWAMTENLNVQVLYPNREIPDAYKQVIDAVDHVNIVGSSNPDISLHKDIVIIENWSQTFGVSFEKGVGYVVRTSIQSLIDNIEAIKRILAEADRLVVSINDISSIDNNMIEGYRNALDRLIPAVAYQYAVGHNVQFNLLTDRIFLKKMNNCNAGWESVTLAPNGKFYVCPAFCLDGDDSIGDLDSGLDIKNPKLYRLGHSPICRVCDAWQCRRCVWLNRKLTLEVNTPGRQQCIAAHIERDASRRLLAGLKEHGIFIPDAEIDKVGYLDPIEKIIK